jgi:hypothetical protein
MRIEEAALEKLSFKITLHHQIGYKPFPLRVYVLDGTFQSVRGFKRKEEKKFTGIIFSGALFNSNVHKILLSPLLTLQAQISKSLPSPKRLRAGKFQINDK